MAAPATSVSSYVKRFEARGHVTREPHPVDRLSYRLHLTAAGRAAHQDAATRFGPVRQRVIEALGTRDLATGESLLALRTVVDALRGDDEGIAVQPG